MSVGSLAALGLAGTWENHGQINVTNGGTLRLSLLSPVDQRIVLARHDRPVRVLRLRAGERWTGTVAGVAVARQCKFELVPDRTVALEKVEFVRPAP